MAGESGFINQNRIAIELINIIRRLYRHPLGMQEGLASIRRFLWWQLYSRLVKPIAIVPFIGPTKLLLRRGMSGATGHFYKGLNEFEFTSFLIHFLRPEDLFVDAGANIGAYSILASGVCGARSIAIEPLPDTFADLQEQIVLNQLENKVYTLNLGLGRAEGQLAFTSKKGQQNHVAVDKPNGLSIPVKTLDQLIGDLSPSLIKIDVEGYELPVLEGANAALDNPSLRAIIIEMMGLGKRYGYTDEEVDALLRRYGFAPYQYLPKVRELLLLDRFREGGNNLYLRGVSGVEARVQESNIFFKGKER